MILLIIAKRIRRTFGNLLRLPSPGTEAGYKGTVDLISLHMSVNEVIFIHSIS